jgi:seryl-tRNA synthetase
MDRAPLLPEEELVCCSACATLHHARCWRENRTCTTLDCRGSPLHVVVARDTATDVRQINAQLDELRNSVNRMTRKLDKVLERENESASKAVADLATRLDARALEGKAETQRVLAALADAVLRIRSLDYTVARHRFPPPAAPPGRPPARGARPEESKS